MGRFPSLDSLLKAAGGAFVRFPLTLISAVVAAIFAIQFVEIAEKSHADAYIMKLVMAGLLGLSLFTVIVLTAEKLRFSAGRKLIAQFVGLGLLVAYYFSLPSNLLDVRMHGIRFLLLGIALHFLVAYLPYLGKHDLTGFWQYNKSLFLRFLLSALYSAVLFVGLAIALAAMDLLFGVDVDEKWYLELWLIMALVANTWIFLAGLPDDLHELNQVTEYPKALRLFSQYILLPLIGLYLVILYIYEAKIIAQWNWPKGWVSELILWYSAVGILALLLLWPLREKSDSKWIRTYTTWFFWLLIPLVVMLFFAILYRIGDYGMTPPRFFVLAMAVGLSVVVLFFVFGRSKDIRVIPIVLSLIAILSAYGPFSAFAVSERSQVGRLNAYIEKHDLLKPEGITTASTILLEDRQEMSSIIAHLSEWYGPDAYSTWFDDSVITRFAALNHYDVRDSIAARLGFQLVFGPAPPKDDRYLQIYSDRTDPVPISGYEQLFRFQFRVSNDQFFDSTQRITLSNNDTLAISLNRAGNGFTFELRNASNGIEEKSELPLSDTLLTLWRMFGGGTLSQEQVTFDIDGEHFRTRTMLYAVNGDVEADSLSINLVNADILVGSR